MLNITHGREITAPDRRSIDLSHDPIDFGCDQNDFDRRQNGFDCDQTDSIAPIALSVITTILTDKELPRFPPTGDDLTSHPDLNVEREPERD
jgi:hypothetical protein